MVNGISAGWLLELLGGKAGVSCGRFIPSNAFGEESGDAASTQALGYIDCLLYDIHFVICPISVFSQFHALTVKFL